MRKRYEKYKESEFKWFENVPDHWSQGRVSYFFEIGRGRVIAETELVDEGKYPVYSLQTKNNGCLGYINTYDYSEKILTWTTDGVNAGSVFLRDGKFNCTNVCGTLKPKRELSLNYFLHLLQYVTQYYKRPDTNGAKIMNNEMAAIKILIPPLPEQTSIARYLDYQTELIDRIISKKQKMVELLKEKRQAVINEAVTGKKVWNGHDWVAPAKTKDSGIEWLGEVPEEWEVVKLGFIVGMKSGDFINSEDIESDGEFPVFGGNGIRGFTSKYNLDGYYPLVGRQGALCGNINYANGKFWATEHAVAVSPKKTLNLYWIGELLRTMNLNQYSQASAQPGLSVERILKLRIPLPKIEVQDKIAKYLKDSVSQTETLIDKINSQIQKLQEYRQSLISEAVTGKIDVREWKMSEPVIE